MPLELYAQCDYDGIEAKSEEEQSCDYYLIVVVIFYAEKGVDGLKLAWRRTINNIYSVQCVVKIYEAAFLHRFLR